MAAKHRLLGLVLLFAILLTNPTTVSASPGKYPYQNRLTESRNVNSEPEAWLADLVNFIAQVANGNPDQLVGVFVPGVFALPVVQQPDGETYAVSNEPGVITQYGSVDRYGNVGLLAHNFLAGAEFFKLGLGQRVTLIYGNGHSRDYTVTGFRQFQATLPESPYSNFIDLDQPGSRPIRSADIFNLIYTGSTRVVLQTCIARQGEPSWGRLFVIATPIEESPGIFRFSPGLWSGRN